MGIFCFMDDLKRRKRRKNSSYFRNRVRLAINHKIYFFISIL